MLRFGWYDIKRFHFINYNISTWDHSSQAIENATDDGALKL